MSTRTTTIFPPRKAIANVAPSPARAGTDRMIDLIAVCAMLGLSKTTVYERLRHDPTFPKSKKVGIRAVRWSEQAVKAWRDALPEYEPMSPVKAKSKLRCAAAR